MPAPKYLDEFYRISPSDIDAQLNFMESNRGFQDALNAGGKYARRVNNEVVENVLDSLSGDSLKLTPEQQMFVDGLAESPSGQITFKGFENDAAPVARQAVQESMPVSPTATIDENQFSLFDKPLERLKKTGWKMRSVEEMETPVGSGSSTPFDHEAYVNSDAYKKYQAEFDAKRFRRISHETDSGQIVLNGFDDNPSGGASSSPAPTAQNTPSTPTPDRVNGQMSFFDDDKAINKSIERHKRKLEKFNGRTPQDIEQARAERSKAHFASESEKAAYREAEASLGDQRVAQDMNEVAFKLDSRGGYHKMRRKLGKQYDSIARDFNSTVQDAMSDFRAKNPTGDFMEELRSPNSELANELFEAKRKLSEGMYDAESQLNAARQDIFDQKGRGYRTGGKKARGTEAMAARHASDDMTRTVDDFGEFGFKKNAEGKVELEYRKGSRQVEGVSSGTRSTDDILQVREIGEDGAKSWRNATKDEIAAYAKGTEAGFTKHNADAKIKVGDKEVSTAAAMTDDLIQSGGYKVRTDANGATVGATRRTIDGLDDSIKQAAAQNNHGPFGNSRANARRAAASDYVHDSRVASKIASTGAAESSGIFKQIANAASKYPGIAAAVAIGGFALANKALDRRNEYD